MAWKCTVRGDGIGIALRNAAFWCVRLGNASVGRGQARRNNEMALGSENRDQASPGLRGCGTAHNVFGGICPGETRGCSGYNCGYVGAQDSGDPVPIGIAGGTDAVSG